MLKIIVFAGVLFAAGVAVAGGLTWPFGDPGTFGSAALDNSKSVLIVIVDPTAIAPGRGLPPRAPLTGF